MSKAKFKGPIEIELIQTVFEALRAFDGSATNQEVRDKVIELLDLNDEVINFPHKGSNSRTELEYRLCWARTKLKNIGAITNTKRSVWMITPDFDNVDKVTKDDYVKYLEKSNNGLSSEEIMAVLDDGNKGNDASVGVEYDTEPWKDELSDLLHNMNPYSFERLSMKLLRECGFDNVKVTQKSKDGGIDGTGKLKINGVFSFNVAFQCKRYAGSVGAPEIRNFRGSLSTDIEKGIFITTGTFTQQAREEASTPGKQQIDLIDGEEFINKLIEYRLGVKEKIVFEIEKDFFKDIEKSRK